MNRTASQAQEPGQAWAQVGLQPGWVRARGGWGGGVRGGPACFSTFLFLSNLQSVNSSLGFCWLQVSVWLTVLIFLCHICVLSRVCLEFRVFVIFEPNDGVCCQLLCRGRGKELCVAFPVLQAFAPSLSFSEGCWGLGSRQCQDPQARSGTVSSSGHRTDMPFPP